MSYVCEGTAGGYVDTRDYGDAADEFGEPPAAAVGDASYNSMELETVEGATIRSGAVAYNSAIGPPTAADGTTYNTATESSETESETVESTTTTTTTGGGEVCRDFIHGRCDRTDCKYAHDSKVRDNNATRFAKEHNLTTYNETCRDFIHGRCDRIGCKFKHDVTERDSERTKLPICKNFQKGGCQRPKCRYLHLTEAQETEFHETGKLPEETPENKGNMVPVPDSGNAAGGGEICRDFMNGNCRRGFGCKYSHGDNNNTTLSNVLYLSGKRPFTSLAIGGSSGDESIMHGENELLQGKLLELRKQVVELTQLNDTLYAENMKFRKQLAT